MRLWGGFCFLLGVDPDLTHFGLAGIWVKFWGGYHWIGSAVWFFGQPDGFSPTFFALPAAGCHSFPGAIYEGRIPASAGSLLKMLYLAMMDITKIWSERRQNWSLIHLQMVIYFAEHMPEQHRLDRMSRTR